MIREEFKKVKIKNKTECTGFGVKITINAEIMDKL
jgi:hypothetical protein